MKYDSKLVFHIPVYTELDNKLIRTVYLDFEKALMHQIHNICTCQMQLSTVKVVKCNKDVDEILLIIFCNSEDVPKATNIFMHLICEWGECFALLRN